MKFGDMVVRVRGRHQLRYDALSQSGTGMWGYSPARSPLNALQDLPSSRGPNKNGGGGELGWSGSKSTYQLL